MSADKPNDNKWCFASGRWWTLWLPVGCVVSLLIGAGAGFATVAAVEFSSSQQFCLGCHEMQAFPFEELKASPHFNNRTGVGPECADCHVPGPIVAKMVRKVQASLKEVPNHFLGKLNTAEKYETHRLEMAQTVWRSMKANDSRECRACHDASKMDLALQSRWAKRKHAKAFQEESGETCIDCHKGIAHKLPEGAEPAS